MNPEREDDLVVLKRTRGPGEAFPLAALLNEAGIEAVVVESTPPGLTGVLGPGAAGAVLHVRQGDRERARRVLEEAASVEIDWDDWDEVDLGDREDRLPLHRPGRMPLAARIAFVVAVIVGAAGLVAGTLTMIQMMGRL